MDLARTIVPNKHPGHFNQGLMDIGSEICTPRNPNCGICPLNTVCEACRNDLQEMLPVTKKRPPLPHHHVTAAVLSDKEGRLLIVQRPRQGLLGGLWKLPGGRLESNESLEKCLRKTVHEELGIRIRVGESIGAVNHAYTHFRITLHAFHCTRHRGNPQTVGCLGWRWINRRRLKDFAFSKADRDIMKVVLSHLK
jgi:A/G-specific adenine glycosylase